MYRAVTRSEWARHMRCAAALCAVGVGLCGCLSAGVNPAKHRLDPYRPDVTEINVDAWYAATSSAAETARVQTASVELDAGTGETETNGTETAETNTAALAETNETEIAKTNERPVPSGGASNGTPVTSGRKLRIGSRVTIRLRGIPDPEQYDDEVDDLGEVTLPLIGAVKVAGLTTSEAERFIERTYVEREFYPRINVIVTAEKDEYFVQGQVARPGKYVLATDLSLLQAIAEAGGFTPYANKRAVRIMREGSNETAEYDAKRISNGDDPDPAIHRGDIVHVPRGW